LVDVLDGVRRHRPALVAIDSPRSAARDGHRSREGERSLAKAVCGIRSTPDAAALQVGDYYEWIREGLASYEALDRVGIDTMEVLPTATWTRWFGGRGTARRAAWTRAGIAGLRLAGIRNGPLKTREMPWRPRSPRGSTPTGARSASATSWSQERGRRPESTACVASCHPCPRRGRVVARNYLSYLRHTDLPGADTWVRHGPRPTRHQLRQSRRVALRTASAGRGLEARTALP